MAHPEKLSDDLSYVRRAVERSEREIAGPSAIYFLWAAIVLVGFALNDVRPEWSGLYWIVMAPLGFLASCLLGGRHTQRLGEADRAEGLRIAGHWLALLAAIALLIPLALAGSLSGWVVGQLTLLLVALAYVLYGVHVERRMLIPGLILAAGYGLLFVLEAYAWTAVGVAVALALVLTPLMSDGGRRRVAPQEEQ